MIEVIGHEREREILARLRPQVVLLTGPEGVGRRTLGHWYAAFLTCGEGPCPAGAPEVLELSPTPGRRPVIPVEKIVPRKEGEGENLLTWLEATPRFRAKVAVIDGAEHLSEAAANAMLKLLEEPPSHGYVVLVAPSRQAVLPTIASRAFHLALAPVPEEKLRELSDDPELLAFAEGAPGRLKWALEHPEEVQDLWRLVRRVLSGLKDGAAASELVEELLRRAEEGLDPFGLFRRAFASLEPEARTQALSLLDRLKEAHRAYVRRDLLAAWFVRKLRSVYGAGHTHSL